MVGGETLQCTIFGNMFHGALAKFADHRQITWMTREKVGCKEPRFFQFGSWKIPYPA